MTLRLYTEEHTALGFDLAQAVQDYKDALKQHQFTYDVPAPTAHPLVETIVREHGGMFELAERPKLGPDPDRLRAVEQFTHKIGHEHLVMIIELTDRINAFEKRIGKLEDPTGANI